MGKKSTWKKNTGIKVREKTLLPVKTPEKRAGNPVAHARTLPPLRSLPAALSVMRNDTFCTIVVVRKKLREKWRHRKKKTRGEMTSQKVTSLPVTSLPVTWLTSLLVTSLPLAPPPQIITENLLYTTGSLRSDEAWGLVSNWQTKVTRTKCLLTSNFNFFNYCRKKSGPPPTF